MMIEKNWEESSHIYVQDMARWTSSEFHTAVSSTAKNKESTSPSPYSLKAAQRSTIHPILGNRGGVAAEVRHCPFVVEEPLFSPEWLRCHPFGALQPHGQELGSQNSPVLLIR
jgi:hypothetical protein